MTQFSKITLGLASLAVGVAVAISAQAQHPPPARGGHAGPAHFVEPRAHGVPQHGSFHNVAPQPGHIVRSPVFHDPRGHFDIRRDPHVVVFNHVGWHPMHNWDYWHRDWGVFWRVGDWAEIQTVTCEAVDTQTQALYPVTETRAAGWVWSPDLVNNVAGRALDECAQENGAPQNCALVQAECWNSVY